MEIPNKLAVAKAISKYMKDNHISPKDVEYIDFQGTSLTVKCHIVMKPMPLFSCRYSFDIGENM
jgi:hypothetical protein